MINLTFHGAARTVTGSRHLLDINGYRYSQERVLAILDKKEPDFIMTGGLITVYNYLKWLTLELHERFPAASVTAFRWQLEWLLPESSSNNQEILWC